MVTRSKAGVFKPKTQFIGLTKSSFDDFSEPQTISAALQSKLWKKAMTDEFNALVTDKTWVLVPFIGKEKPVDCKWVFKTKVNSDGSFSRAKARLVAKRFQQHRGIDYEETFSPVLKLVTLRLILNIVGCFKWPVRQLDINNALLNGYLQERVYMKQPEGFADRR